MFIAFIVLSSFENMIFAIFFSRIPFLILISICSLGLLFQIGQVSERYFRYGTGTIVNLFVPEEIYYPWMSVCFEYNDLINRSLFRSKYNVTLKYWHDTGYNGTEFNEQTKKLTVSQMFELTPSVDDILDDPIACQIHLPDKFNIDHMDKKLCNVYIHIKKYLIRNTVC